MFFGRKKNKNERREEQSRPTEKGLKIKQIGNEEYAVYQMQTEEKILSAKTKERATEAKRRLDGIIDWNTEKDVYLSILQGDTDFSIFEEMNRIIDFYEIEEEDEEEESYPTETENGEYIYYEVKDENGLQNRVKGERITQGLAIHQERGGGWTIDHIPSRNMLTEFSKYEDAKKCAVAIADIVKWNDEKTVQLIQGVPDFKEYLRLVKQAVIRNQDIPERPQRLLYKMEILMEFFRIKTEKSNVKQFCRAIDRLMDMSGLDVIKQEVLGMIYSLAGQKKNEGKVKQSNHNLHMVFLGPAGTGKTEVARIMSEILASLGYLEKGNLVEVDRSTLVGTHIGETAKLVKKAVSEAMGGTLFIDEAYSLATGGENDFGKEAIATLIKEMEDNKGKFSVILAGYQADMNTLLNANEGFRSRIKHYFHFYDYTPKQIADIVGNILEGKGYIVPSETKEECRKAVNRIAKQGKVEGNAREARNIAENIEEALNIRIGKDVNKEIFDTNLVTIEDVKMATDPKMKSQKREELEEIKQKALQKLQNLIGLQDLKSRAQSILNTIVIDNMRYQNELTTTKSRMHMVYLGPPGTGKTTVARIMGEFLKGSGMLSSGHYVEASRSDLVAGYVGQTAPKVKDVVAKAMGGVLFIDEAYSLASGDKFGKEALDTLIKEMEDHGDNLVVILAGYKKEMDDLMELNVGLSSRIPYHIDFPHYNAEELYEISLLQLRQSYGLVPTEKAKEFLQAYIQWKVNENSGYVEGDGRWIRNLAEELKTHQSNRLANFPPSDITVEKLKELTVEDIQKITA